MAGAFAVFVRQAPALALLSLAPAAFAVLYAYFLFEPSHAALTHLLRLVGIHPAIVSAVAAILILVLFSAFAAVGLTALAVADLRAGRRPRVLGSLVDSARPAVGLLLLAVLAAAVVVIALHGAFWIPAPDAAGLLVLLLLLPALPDLAVAVPVLVVERQGRAAATRTVALTAGYRAAILGTLLVLSVASGVLTVALAVGWDIALEGIMTSLLAAFPAAVPGYPFRPIVWAIVPLTLGPGPLYVGIALIYVRLREIKEGAGEVADVFA